LLTHYLFFKWFLAHYKRFLLLFRILKTKFKQIIILYYYFTILKPIKKKEKIERRTKKVGDIYGIPDSYVFSIKSLGKSINYYKSSLLPAIKGNLKYKLNKKETKFKKQKYIILDKSFYRSRVKKK